MKKHDLKNINMLKRTLYNQLVTSFKRVSRIFGNDAQLTSNLQVTTRGLPDIILAYDRQQKINAQLLEMEMHKAEAIQLMRENNSRV